MCGNGKKIVLNISLRRINFDQNCRKMSFFCSVKLSFLSESNLHRKPNIRIQRFISQNEKLYLFERMVSQYQNNSS